MILDRRLFWPALMQCLAMAAPFFYLRAAIGHSRNAAVEGESILSIVGFAAIAIDFSASTFLARTQSRLLNSGALTTILLGRLAVASILLICSVVFLAVTGNSPLDGFAVSLVAMLLGIVADPSWIYIGRGHLWVPAIIATIRFGAAALLTLTGMLPILSLAIAFLFSSLFFLALARLKLSFFGRFKWHLCIRLARRYYMPTLTEGLTAVFSRLDVAIAVAVLPTQDALIYAVIRKLIVGLQSVAFSGARFFYLERDPKALQSLQRALLKNTLLILAGGLPVSLVVAVWWFNLPLDTSVVSTLALLAIIVLLGYKKTLVQFGQLYVHRRFSSDLLFSAVSMLSFAALCALLAQSDSPSVIAFASIRVAADVIYLVMARFKPITANAA
jgi:hypothetical protein